MAVHVDGVFKTDLNDKIRDCNILVVGAGGIGCELLKNLVMTGFEKIHIIDLDTIELSNLNRQFLFHKQHIGRSKAEVAKESVLKFNPRAVIIAEHDSITSTKYDVNFFRQFTVVANALDNVAARSHVNRMCLAADVPLIESGTSGYTGQVTVYKKSVSECFECLPRQAQKSYPGCTIRNTPSEPVHCIVWAKHLFNQLFGETDADEDVSPDLTEPSLEKQKEKEKADGNVIRISTREWAKSVNFNPEKLFVKLFETDINYLKTMTDLWEMRKTPQTLNLDNLINEPEVNNDCKNNLKDQKIWSLHKCKDIFFDCVEKLTLRLKVGGSDKILIWDKDDECAMDFVAACANLRAYCFHIKILTKFEIKSIAGNIVPAIATTNAIISGLLVLQIIKVLQGDFKKCRTCWLNTTASGGAKMISSAELAKPNPECMVCCSSIPQVSVTMNLNTLTVKTLNEKILKERLHLVQPDVYLINNTATLLISSDPEDYDESLMNKTLSDFSIKSGISLACEDYFQHYKISLIPQHNSEFKDQEYKFDAELADLESLAKEAAQKEAEKTEENDLCEIPQTELENVRGAEKTKAEESSENEPPAKKRKSIVE